MSNQKTQPSLIIADVDGTLLDSHSNLRHDTRSAVAEALSAGIGFTLASGRNTSQLEATAESLGLTLPIISLGGACLSIPSDGTPLWILKIDPEILEHLIQRARTMELGIMLQSPRNNVLESDPQIIREISRISHGNFTPTTDINKSAHNSIGKVTLIGDEGDIAQIHEELTTGRQELHAVLSGRRFLDITANGADKGSAVQKLLKYLKLPSSSVAAIGDGHNDLSMFQSVGFRIAMGNSLNEVKRAADLIAPDHDEGGAAWAIRELIHHSG
jgi:Cof subfamily protein (haloacid dehalogenase superfamily)